MTTENWIPCPKPVAADTIRWREPIWDAPNKPRGKPDKIGEQMITARVVTKGDPMELQVIDIKRLSLIEGAKDTPSKIQKSDLIRRKASSIQAGECEKLSQED